MRRLVEVLTEDPLAARVDATPDRIALVDTEDDRQFTYRDLDRLVERTANRLNEHVSTSKVNTIGCLLSTRPAFVAVLFAALRTGNVFSPLNIELARPELAAAVDRADPDLLCCERPTEQLALDGTDCPVVSVDTPTDKWVPELDLYRNDREDSPADSTPSTVGPDTRDADETVAVVFTSGSTGDPKGVRLTMGNLLANATASAFRLGITAEDRWLCCLPMYHMSGFAPVIRSVLYGTTLVLQPSFDVDRTSAVIDSEAITGVSLVPTQLTRLLNSGWSSPESLRTVLLGGAPATEHLMARADEANVPVFPTYGTTETASQIATAVPEEAKEHPETVGRPVLGTDVTVLADGEPVEAGERGELVVDGPTVSPGYLDAARSEAAFCEHGFRTGDLGYRDEAGRIWILGRIDQTIITGGKLVAPTEVERTIRSHSEVDDVAVVGIDDEEWGERVGALVVTSGDVGDGELRDHCRGLIASYKLPKTVVRTESIPRTVSGTVDREAVRSHVAGGR